MKNRPILFCAGKTEHLNTPQTVRTARNPSPHEQSPVSAAQCLLECGPGANSSRRRPVRFVENYHLPAGVAAPQNTLHQQQTQSPRPDSAALGRGDSWTWKLLREPPPPRTRPEDTCSDVRNRQAPCTVGRPAQPRSPVSLLTGPPRSLLATTPESGPPPPGRRTPAGTLGPAAWARRGHLTVRIPPAALRGLHGRSKGRAGPGGRGRWRRRGLGGGGGSRGGGGGGGGEREGRHTGGRPLSHFPRDREIASRQPIKCLHEGAGCGGRPETRDSSFRPCAELLSRLLRSTDWRESQKASAASG